MTKRLECVVEGCDAVIEAETEDEVMDQASAHAEDAHPEMDLDEAAVASIRESIQDV